MPLRPTPADILGPFYRPGSPFRTRLIDPVTRATQVLVIQGQVLDPHGNPITRAYVDFWQADETGKYDEDGPNFRGIQQVDAKGCYLLVTVRPGAYDISEADAPLPHEFRCAHIHAKIWVDGTDVLTTQLYFADDPLDAADHWFSKDRLIQFTSAGNGVFDFVV
jgi:protocatechuate 3,4-dioxygenase beta subunit